MAKFIVLLGPPGAGKGTQAAVVAKKLKIAHISSGNLFRENIDNRTELGLKAQSYIDSGQLVPDDLTIAMVKERISRSDCGQGAILDGFPRTVEQAEALDKLLKENHERIEKVAFINVPEEVLVERLSGRWLCESEKHVYHLKFKPPIKTGICDVDGSSLHQRHDDERKTVERRIREYQQKTAPLIDYYRKAGKLLEIDGTMEIELVSKQILNRIDASSTNGSGRKNKETV
jgi:adenylate kinase